MSFSEASLLSLPEAFIDKVNNTHHISIDTFLYLKYAILLISTFFTYIYLTNVDGYMKVLVDAEKILISEGKKEPNKYEPRTFWSFLTNWSVVMFYVYEILSTFRLKMDINSPYYQNLLKIDNFGHWLN